MSGVMLDEVAAYLAAQGRGTVGTTIFGNMLPDSPANCIALFESPGMKPVLGMASQVAPHIEMPQLQVRVRNETYASARDISHLIYNDLLAVVSVVLTGTLYFSIEPTGIPTLLDRDQHRWVHYSCNYAIQKRPS